MLRVEAYHKRYEDLALQSRDFRIVPGGRGSSRGVDFFYKGRLPFGGIEMRSISSYLVARRSDPASGVLVNAAFDVRSTHAIIAERGFANGVRLGATYRSASGKPYTPITGASFDAPRNVYVPMYGAEMSERFPGLRRFDVSLSRFRPLSPSLLSVVYASLSNVFNHENVQSWSYSRDYTQRVAVPSIFNRSVYFGASLIWQ